MKKLTAEIASMALACRLFGGYIVDEEWMAAATQVHQITGQKLIPNICFDPAIKKEREVLIHNSILKKSAWAMSVLAQANPTSNTESRWAFRADRNDIKKDADALVVCAREKDMQHARKKKAKVAKKFKEKRAALRKEGQGNPRLAKKIKKWEGKARKYRGAPVTLCEFAKQIEQVA